MIDIIIAIIIDWIIGDPPVFPHPIRLMGNIIAYEDKMARKMAKTDKQLLGAGFIIVVVNVTIAFLVPYLLLSLLTPYPYLYHAVNIYFLYTCIAARCLHIEAMNIYRALTKSLNEARYKLSFIVGRETKDLREEEIVSATVETVAENTSDGVIAPLVFAMIGGAPLAVVYKMVNTMDSMLGYRTEKYKDIGFFPAKTDDLFNFVPARLTGLLLNVSGLFRFDVIQGFKIMWKDRKNHKSPNCAYPEGSVAGLLGVRLGGDHVYFGELVKKPTIGVHKRKIDKEDIKRAIELMYKSEILLVILYMIINLLGMKN